MNRRQRAATYRRPIRVPPPPQDMPPPRPGNRAPVPAAARLAGYGAHMCDRHHGHADPRCHVCASYVAALNSWQP